MPELVLDNEEYEDILEEAKNIVISMYPEWTDYNYHDPGITMLELFAFVKESQQYFLDRIGEENRRKYLKLLGITRRTKMAAKSLVKFNVTENLKLLCRNKLGAGDLCFEVQGRKQLIGGDISACMAISGERLNAYLDKEQLEFGHSLRFRPFGREPQNGSAFYLRFDAPLPENMALDLYLKVFQGYPVKRNPLGDGEFVPLVELEFAYYTAEGWKKPEILRDETYGFLFDGFIHFILSENMASVRVQEVDGYYLRIVLRDGTYDVVPVLTQISMNISEVRQADTLVEHQRFAPGEVLELDTELAVTGRSDVWLRLGEIYYPAEGFQKEIKEDEGIVRLYLEDKRAVQADEMLVVNMAWSMPGHVATYKGNGFPCQKIDLEDVQVEYESLQLLVQDVECEGGYRLWEKVRDFGRSSPEDAHYVFDSRQGIIQFGDCIRGIAPEGEIIFIGYVRTMGSDGNVRQGKIDHFLLSEDTGINLYNICDGTGGRDEERLEECFLRARRSLRKPDCAVTGRDYEEYVEKTPGLMIEGCKALHLEDIRQFMKKVDEAAVYLAVKPYSPDGEGKISTNYYRNIRGYLEKFRLVGSRIFILLPEYVYVEVYVEAAVKPQYGSSMAARLNGAVMEFFDRYRRSFGGIVSFGELYGYMDRQEFVTGIRSLNLDIRGSGARRDHDGNIVLAPNAVVMLKDVRCSFAMEEGD